MAAEKKPCSVCGKKVMHYEDRTIEKHRPPGKNVNCTKKTY